MIRALSYLIFENALEASKYYTQLFGAKIVYRKAGNSEVAAHFKITDRTPEDLTLHGAMEIADNLFTFADSFVFKKTENAAFLLSVQRNHAEDLAALETLYDKVSADESVKILHSYQETDFGGKEGILLDKYGIRWHFVAEPDLDFLKK